jgi:hypothetical protein
MADDRLFHRRLGQGDRVNQLTPLEEIAWYAYILAADDFSVLPFDALELQRMHRRLHACTHAVVQRMFATIFDVGLIRLFEHQRRVYCYQPDWQDWQKIRYAFRTIYPPIPAAILPQCTRATQWLWTVWPGGGRNSKLKQWEPPATWTAPDWAVLRPDEPRNGSGPVADPFRNGSGPRARGRDARVVNSIGIDPPEVLPATSSKQGRTC